MQPVAVAVYISKSGSHARYGTAVAFKHNVVRQKHLRILHGKGNGILRHLVREYLATCGVVKTFRDEHVEFGGAGITIVEMDV